MAEMKLLPALFIGLQLELVVEGFIYAPYTTEPSRKAGCLGPPSSWLYLSDEVTPAPVGYCQPCLFKLREGKAL